MPAVPNWNSLGQYPENVPVLLVVNHISIENAFAPDRAVGSRIRAGSWIADPASPLKIARPYPLVFRILTFDPTIVPCAPPIESVTAMELKL